MKLPKAFLESAKRCNYNTALMQTAGISHLYVKENNILSSYNNPGLKITAESFSRGVKMKLVVARGVKIEKPIFLCFGVLEPKGRQTILQEIILEENSRAKIFAHCTFPQAKNVLHKMEANIELKKEAELYYSERHYHGENFGANVLADFKILLGSRSSFRNEFTLKDGSIGKLKINLEAKLKRDSLAEIVSKVIGRGAKDKAEIFDRVFLEGENSRALIKLKGAPVNGGKMFFQGEAEAGRLARNARAHIDCDEIIIGRNSLARSIPIVTVRNPEARITHEASVGKVNQKELETLMTRGLSEKEAIDFIIRVVIR